VKFITVLERLVIPPVSVPSMVLALPVIHASVMLVTVEMTVKISLVRARLMMP